MKEMVKAGRQAWLSLAAEAESSSTRACWNPTIALEYLVEQPSQSNAALSGVAVKKELRRESWMATEQAIGQGLSRVELFGQSTLAASREFDFLVYHKHQSLLDRKGSRL